LAECPSTHHPSQGEASSRGRQPHLCRSLLRHLSGVRLASSSWLGCIAVPSHLDSFDSSLRLASSGWLVVLLVLLIWIRLIPSRLCSTTGNLTTPPVIVVVVSHDREPCGTVWGSMYPTCRVAVAGSFLLCLIRWLSLAGSFFVHLFCLLILLPSFFVLFFD